MVHSRSEFNEAIALAKKEDRLVLLTVFSEEVCELVAEPEGWEVKTTSLDDGFAPCSRISEALARIAKQAKEVVFIEIEGEENEETIALCKELNVDTYPTFQYWKNGDLLYEHKGAGKVSEREIAEAVLFFGGQMADGELASTVITDIKNKATLEDFMSYCMLPQSTPIGVKLDVPCDKQLACINVSKSKGSPACMHIFPSVVALAKNTAGAVRWGRLLVDESPEGEALALELGVKDIPAFVFFVDGKKIGTYAGSDRIELVQKVLMFQKDSGVKMPEPPPKKRMSTAEAKKLQKEKSATATRPANW